MPERPKGADCKSAGTSLRWFESTSLHEQIPQVKEQQTKDDRIDMRA